MRTQQRRNISKKSIGEKKNKYKYIGKTKKKNISKKA